MARRRQKDSFEELLDLLAEMPWWVSIVFGLVVYVLTRSIVPVMWPDTATMSGAFAKGISQLSWFSLIFVVPAAVSFFRSIGKSRMLDRQSGIESIRALPWKRFEELLGEAYRRQGFAVFENPGAGADGGIDLTIKRAGETHLVQCKHWKTHKVGVKVVREMLGLITAHGAAGAIVVTSGTFTHEAASFAAAQRIELVDGDALVRLIGAVQARPVMTVSQPVSASRICPRCGSELVLRQAKRGANAGGQFWGCGSYPNCRHTEAAAG